MGPIALIGLGVIAWLWWSGRLPAFSAQTLLSIVLGVLAARFILLGEVLPGLGLGVATALLYFRPGKSATPPIDVAEARLLLDIDAQADAGAIRDAHRRIIARVHPDAGGSPELARRVNAARDLLLRRLNDPSSRAS